MTTLRTQHRNTDCAPGYRLTMLVAALIAALTLLPVPQAADSVTPVPYADKMVHFLMFGVLASVWWRERTLRFGLPRLRMQDYALVALYTIIAGGLDELLQSWIAADRSADASDWLADAAGAVAVPFLSIKLVAMKLPVDAMRLVRLRRPQAAMDEMESIYMASFPPEERRQWREIVDYSTKLRHPMRFTLITVGGRPVGFITWWKFKGFRYVEHFAVDSAQRGRGYGERAMNMFVARQRSTVVLEVEPASSGEMAQRRIRFYQRCGFRPHPDYRYIQPPYASGLPEVPLMLMTASYMAISLDLAKIDRCLKMMVYRVA